MRGAEWGFGRVLALYNGLAHKIQQKSQLSPVALQYKTATILTNCRTCMDGHNITSLYFDCSPPGACASGERDARVTSPNR